MVWLFVILAALLSPVIVEGTVVLFRHFKKQEIVWKEVLWRLLSDEVLVLPISILLTSFLVTCYARYEDANVFFFLLSFGVAISALQPYDLWKTLKNKEKLPESKWVDKGIKKGLLLLALVLEMTLFNASSFKGKDNVRNISPSDSSITLVQNFELQEDGSLKGESKNGHAVLEYHPVEKGVTSSIQFNLAEENAQIDLSVFYLEENDEWKYDASYSINANHPEYCIIGLRDSAAYQFHFDLSTIHGWNASSFSITGFTLNQKVAFHFVPARFLIEVALIYLATHFYHAFIHKEEINEEKRRHGRLKWGLLITFGVAFLCLLIVALIFPKDYVSLLTQYPFQDGELDKVDVFLQMFDAFRKGQIHLDLPVSDKLIALGDDVYDPYARAFTSYYWDRAFYHGQYYSYFGAAPVILVMFPIYFLTGLVPTGYFLEILGFIIITLVLIYAAVVLAEIFNIRIHWPFFAFMLLSVFVGGLYLNIPVFRQTDLTYRVPIVYGLANALLFLAATFTAYHDKRYRILFLGLASFFFVALVGSRPDFAICFLTVIPLYLKMLLTKEETWKKKLITFAPCLIIVISGAALLMIYNYRRFDSIFEFGSSYQLTVMDARNVKLGMDDVLPGLFHYWIQPFGTESYYSFPFIHPIYTPLSIDTHVYKLPTIGILNNPLFYGIFLLPFCFEKKDGWEIKTMIVLLPITMLLNSVVLYGFGGCCFRYMVMLWPMVAFYDFIIMLKALSIKRKYPIAEAFIGLFCLGGCFVGLQLVSNGFDGLLGDEMGGILYELRELFGNYNLASY